MDTRDDFVFVNRLSSSLTIFFELMTTVFSSSWLCLRTVGVVQWETHWSHCVWWHAYFVHGYCYRIGKQLVTFIRRYVELVNLLTVDSLNNNVVCMIVLTMSMQLFEMNVLCNNSVVFRNLKLCVHCAFSIVLYQII